MIALLSRIGRLRGYFTQNIDGIDESLGMLPMSLSGEHNGWDSFLQLHGSVRWLKCSVCSWKEPWTDEWWEKFQNTKKHVNCPACPQVSRFGRPVKGGYVRTEVLLYGEPHPDEETVISHFNYKALGEPDLLLIIGTSLNTASSTSLLQLVRELSISIRQCDTGCIIFMNKDSPPPSLEQHIDYMLAGDLQTWSLKIMETVS
ncbi:hypothetical protein RSAG8_09011, partial [Rhizoctonia solani AG-8 WAC10335]